MKKFAVAYMNFSDNDLTVKVIKAESWKEALENRLSELYPDSEDCYEFSDNIEVEKEEAFNQDWLFDVTEV